MNDNNEWIESFAQDMFDPTSFKRAFLKVMKPIGDGMLEPIRFKAYKYQDAWTQDDSPKKIVIKSRQVGFSVNESLDTLHSAIVNDNYKKLFTSLKQEQATKNITVIAEAIELMDHEFRIKLRRKSDRMLEFPNGSKIYAMPTSNDGARGFSGDIFLDEFAFVPNDKELLRGIQSVAVRQGYKISMGSTPMGRRGEFHRIALEAGWDTSRTWLDDSNTSKREFMSEYKRVLEENNSQWSFHVIPWWSCPDITWDDILKASETELDREQEFGLGFLDDTTSMFSFDILTKRSNSKQRLFNEDKAFYAKPSNVRRVSGLDPAEKINSTAYTIWDYNTTKRTYHKRFQKLWVDVPLSDYVNFIAQRHRAWNLDHMYIDGTGMGVGVHAMFRDRGFTESMMTKLKYTNTLKYDMVHNGATLYEEEPQRIYTDMDKEYNTQFHQVRKEVNRYGKAKYSGKHEGKDDDIFWSAMMGIIENIDLDDGEVWFDVMYRNELMKANRYGK